MKLYYVGKKVVGRYDSGVFRKDVRGSKHLFRVLDAWGLDSQVFNDLPATTNIRIFDEETNMEYNCTKEDYIENGQYKHFKEGTKDFYTQIFLPRKYFTQEHCV